MQLTIARLNRATNRHVTHIGQSIEGCYQILAPTNTEHNYGITLQSRKPVSASIGYATLWPAAGRYTKTQYAADLCCGSLNACKVSLGSEPDHAPTYWASIPTYFKWLRKTGKTHWHKSVTPNHGVTAMTRARSRPAIVFAQLRNFLEIQINR